jgi:hypothetical protein
MLSTHTDWGAASSAQAAGFSAHKTTIASAANIPVPHAMVFVFRSCDFLNDIT